VTLFIQVWHFEITSTTHPLHPKRHGFRQTLFLIGWHYAHVWLVDDRLIDLLRLPILQTFAINWSVSIFNLTFPILQTFAIDWSVSISNLTELCYMIVLHVISNSANLIIIRTSFFNVPMPNFFLHPNPSVWVPENVGSFFRRSPIHSLSLFL